MTQSVIKDRGAATLAYQRGDLSAEGLRQYQLWRSLDTTAFKDSSAAVRAYQEGLLSPSGVVEYQRGHLGHNQK